METLARIIDLSLERLNNAEYANHMTRFLALIPVKQEDRPEIESVDLTGPAALGFTDEQINTFKNELNILTDVVNKSLISDETALLAETDKQRDELVVYFTSTVRQMTKSPVSAQRNAAISLYNQVKIYVGIQKLADQQETQQILGLLLDMEKEANKSNVTTLGLTSVLEELKTCNDTFIALTEQRSANKISASIDNGKVVRGRMDQIYGDMTLLAQSYNVVQPTGETTAFVTALNALIGETKARYNQRVGIAKANKNKKKPDDRPEIE